LYFAPDELLEPELAAVELEPELAAVEVLLLLDEPQAASASASANVAPSQVTLLLTYYLPRWVMNARANDA
jgi:hypothetical protein